MRRKRVQKCTRCCCPSLWGCGMLVAVLSFPHLTYPQASCNDPPACPCLRPLHAVTRCSYSHNMTCHVTRCSYHTTRLRMSPYSPICPRVLPACPPTSQHSAAWPTHCFETTLHTPPLPGPSTPLARPLKATPHGRMSTALRR